MKFKIAEKFKIADEVKKYQITDEVQRECDVCYNGCILFFAVVLDVMLHKMHRNTWNYYFLCVKTSSDLIRCIGNNYF